MTPGHQTYGLRELASVKPCLKYFNVCRVELVVWASFLPGFLPSFPEFCLPGFLPSYFMGCYFVLGLGGGFWFCLFALNKNKSKYLFQYILYIPPPPGCVRSCLKTTVFYVPVLCHQRSVVSLGEGEALYFSKNILGQILQLKDFLLRA